MLRINSVSEVAAKKISESSGVRVAEFKEFSSSDRGESNEYVIFYFFLDCVGRKINDIPVICVVRECFSSFLGAVHNSQTVVKEQSCIEAHFIGFRSHSYCAVNLWKSVSLADDSIGKMNSRVVAIEQETVPSNCVMSVFNIM